MTLGQFLTVLAGGALFGFGLALSTMVRPEVVLSFLRFQDFGLMLVMGGAVVVTLLAYLLLPRLLGQPLLGGYFHQHVGNWSLLWALAGIALGALVQGLRAKA